MKKSLTILMLLSSASLLFAQMPDTTGIYGERKDSLNASVAVSSVSANFINRTKELRTEVISAAGLCKMACCNLAESFENSASVSVGYSDAVTGARQIRLLGQSGIYTQMLDENRPVMRGLSAPWGLSFVPGQWLESIQIAKGVASVINGVESMTGQINMEHRKPTDEKPLYVQASAMSDSKCDINVISSLQLDPMSKWSTVILAHADGNFKSMDGNADGFMDDPLSRNFALSNRWLYYSPSGLQVRFGARAIYDDRFGGQGSETGKDTFWSSERGDDLWKADIGNRSVNAYVKVGMPLSESQEHSIAMVADYTWQNLGADYGVRSHLPFLRSYTASQQSAFVNLLYQDNSNDSHKYTLGISDSFDAFCERFGGDTDTYSRLNILSAFGEYTFHYGDVFSLISGLRAEWYNLAGLRLSPRITLKWSPLEQLVFRGNAGRGLRYSTPITDNIGILSTSKIITGPLLDHPLEDSWTAGANVTWYLPFDESGKTSLSLDYFHTRFTQQLLVDNRLGNLDLYLLSEVGNGHSHTGNWQLDFTTSPLRGLTLTLTGRYTDARQTLRSSITDVKPMTSLYKAVFNAQYATRLNKWIFDFTASLNGPCRVWDFMKTSDGPYADGYTQAYPLLYAQVTKRFKGFDVYVGGENLTGFTQKDPIINAENPLDGRFDASCIWGPLMGVKIYAGIRLTIWKTE